MISTRDRILNTAEQLFGEHGIDVTSLREISTEWETQVSEIVEKDEELAATIRKMEDEYDSDLVSFQAEET